MAVYELPDGSQYELDLSNPEHKAWLEQKSKGGKTEAAQAPATPQRSIVDSLVRQVGLTARAGGRGLAGLGGLVVDPISAGINAVTGAKIPTGAASADAAMDMIGLPKPEGRGERIVGDMASALAGTGGVLTGAQQAAKAANPIIQALAQTLQTAPKTQAAASALSGGAASTVKEGGGGPGAQTVAALMAGSIPGLVAGAAEPVSRIGTRLVEPFSQAGRDAAKSRILRELSGDKIDDVVAALGRTNPKVPGMTYDAALAAEPAGSTEIQALAKALSRRIPTDAKNLADANAAARMREIQKISGTPADLEWAKNLRSETAAVTYPAAFRAKIQGDPALAKLFQNPFIRRAAEESADLSKAQGINPKTQLTEFLQNVKFGLDKMVSGQSSTVLGTAEKKEALNAQKALISWLEAKNPAYNVARTNFAEQSRPINRMEIGKVLAEKLGAPLDDAERAGVFAQAVRDAPGTLKSATGNPRYSELAQALLPKQVRSVENVQDELARLRSVSQQASAGAERARDVVGTAFEPIEPPSFLHRGVTLLRALLERSQRGTSKKTLEELARDFQSPEKIRDLLTKVHPDERAPLIQALQQYMAGGAIGASTGAATSRGQ